jgi:hypothetical protein
MVCDGEGQPVGLDLGLLSENAPPSFNEAREVAHLDLEQRVILEDEHVVWVVLKSLTRENEIMAAATKDATNQTKLACL